MYKDSASLLASGDIDGLLAMHRERFGSARMEGDAGDAGAGTGGDAGDAGAGTPQAFTQADVDRIVAERLNRQKSQYKDFDTFKAAHDELQKLKDANATETEKATKRAEAAEKAAADAVDRAVRAEIKAIATGEFADPSDAYLYAGDLSRFVKDGEIDSDAIEATLQDVVKAKPHLATRARTDVGLGARGGNGALSPNAAMNQQIRQAAGR